MSRTGTGCGWGRLTGVVLVAVLAAPGIALGWGSDGHRIVGEIAYQELNDTARPEVHRLLPNRGRYRTLFEAATWADTYARQYERFDYLQPHHYITVDPDANQANVGNSCNPEVGCVTSAIIDNTCLLESGSGSQQKRRQALYLVAHFVGDVHQPLHVSHPDGRGGNLTYPRFFGERKKLHAVWDTEIIRYHLKNYENWRFDADEFEDTENDYASWDIYAAELRSTIDPRDAQRWRGELSLDTWVSESFRLAKRHAFPVTNSWRLDERYFGEVRPVIEKRLQQGGVRLGALLNATFDDNASLPFSCD